MPSVFDTIRLVYNVMRPNSVGVFMSLPVISILNLHIMFVYSFPPTPSITMGLSLNSSRNPLAVANSWLIQLIVDPLSKCICVPTISFRLVSFVWGLSTFALIIVSTCGCCSCTGVLFELSNTYFLIPIYSTSSLVSPPGSHDFVSCLVALLALAVLAMALTIASLPPVGL